MKDLTPSAWEGFVATHRPGDVVRGKVSRFTNFGVFVELGDGLEGLCHISELSDERVDRAESVAELGQEMDFKILRIEPADQKIGLSHRAVGKEDAPVADAKMYSSEAKSGMASLGELANLKFGSAAEEVPAPESPEEKKKVKKAAKQAKADEFAAKEAAAKAEAPAEPVEAQADEVPSEAEALETVESPTDSVKEAEPVPEAKENRAVADEAAEPTEDAAVATETVEDTPTTEVSIADPVAKTEETPDTDKAVTETVEEAAAVME